MKVKEENSTSGDTTESLFVDPLESTAATPNGMTGMTTAEKHPASSPSPSPSLESSPGTSPSPAPTSKTLYIVSYDRHTLPDPPVDLEYDVRSTENPPKKARVLHTGLSEGLQNKLLENEKFSGQLGRAEKEIKDAMRKKEQEAKQTGEGAAPATLRVGCLCGSGHHRSVAFGEQLRKIEWLDGWEVKLKHRDLTDMVRGVKAEKRKELKRRRREKEQEQDGVQ